MFTRCCGTSLELYFLVLIHTLMIPLPAFSLSLQYSSLLIRSLLTSLSLALSRAFENQMMSRDQNVWELHIFCSIFPHFWNQGVGGRAAVASNIWPVTFIIPFQAYRVAFLELIDPLLHLPGKESRRLRKIKGAGCGCDLSTHWFHWDSLHPPLLSPFPCPIPPTITSPSSTANLPGIQCTLL